MLNLIEEKIGELHMIRFIHTADLHLDQPFKKLKNENEQLYSAISHATYHSFENLIDTAINEIVDFVLIAGDIFDANHGTLQAQFTFNKGMERLKQADIPVYLAFGNHDYLNESAHRLAMPDNVHVFSANVNVFKFISKSGETVNLAGFSYVNRWIKENKASEFPTRDPEADYQIGVLHGDLQGEMTKNNYAPFTINDLKRVDYNYWALGHIHQRQVINNSPLAVYPGNIQGSSFKENGPKGALLVSLQPYQSPSLEFVELTDWQFLSKVNPLPKIQNLEDLRSSIEQVLHEFVMYAKEHAVNVIVRIEFSTSGDEESLYWWNNYSEEMLEQLQWSLANQNKAREQKVYLGDLNLVIEKNVTWSPSSVFHDALKENWQEFEDTQKFNDITGPLLKHPQWQRLMSPRIEREQFQRDVLEKAVEFIVVEQATNQQSQRRG